MAKIVITMGDLKKAQAEIDEAYRGWGMPTYAELEAQNKDLWKEVIDRQKECKELEAQVAALVGKLKATRDNGYNGKRYNALNAVTHDEIEQVIAKAKEQRNEG